MEAILTDKHTRALYIYPTKALAQDQLRAINELIYNSKSSPYVTSDNNSSGIDNNEILQKSTGRNPNLHTFSVPRSKGYVSSENCTYPLPIKAAICDGDTPHPDRNSIRKECNIVLTNPDMLHYTLLPEVN